MIDTRACWWCVTGRHSSPAFRPLSFPSHCCIRLRLCPCLLPISAAFTLPIRSLSSEPRQHCLTGKYIPGSGKKGEKSGRLGHETAPPSVRRLLHKNCRILLQGLFIFVPLVLSLHISVFIHNSHTTEASYSPSSLIGSASAGMFWLRRFLRSSPLISEA